MNKMMPTTVYSGIKNTEDCVITLQTMSKRGIQYRMWLVGQLLSQLLRECSGTQLQTINI